MATCPECGTSSRTQPGALWLDAVLVTSPLTAQSLSGSQLKTGARRLRLSCRCGWKILGEVRDGVFWGDSDEGMRTEWLSGAASPSTGEDPTDG